MWLFNLLFSSLSQLWYVEVRISRSVSVSLLEFEITSRLYLPYILIEEHVIQPSPYILIEEHAIQPSSVVHFTNESRHREVFSCINDYLRSGVAIQAEVSDQGLYYIYRLLNHTRDINDSNQTSQLSRFRIDPFSEGITKTCLYNFYPIRPPFI